MMRSADDEKEEAVCVGSSVLGEEILEEFSGDGVVVDGVAVGDEEIPDGIGVGNSKSVGGFRKLSVEV